MNQIHTLRWVFLGTLCFQTSSLQSDEIARAASGFFQNHCVDCHDSSNNSGGLNLTALGSDLHDPKTVAAWERIHDRVQQGEMPPAENKPPTPSERAAFISTIATPLIAAHAQTKGTVLRRLNAQEYENTINDLFGTHLELAAMLPPDGRSHEFENVGSSLNMSMVQLRQYIFAMKVVLDESISKFVIPPSPKLITTNYAETSEGKKFIGDKWFLAKDGAVVFFQDFGYPTGMLRTAGTQNAGWYKIRVRGYAYQTDQPITFSVGGTTFQRGLERPTFGYFAFQPGQPQTVELMAWIENRYMLEITPYGIYDERYEIKNKGVENYTGPGLAVQSVELEGPLVEEFPTRGHKLLFDGINRNEIEPRNPNDKTKSWYQPQFQVVTSEPVTDAMLMLQRVATSAFRHPATMEEVQPFVDLFAAELAAGDTFEGSLRTAVTAIFCAPGFLYFDETAGELNDFALAVRLSYFLNRTQPDAQLLKLASQGTLTHDTQQLRNETERLLQGPHAERFFIDFTDAWLNLRDIELTAPDRNLFPEYDPFLLDSMIKETRAYFAEQLAANTPIQTIVKSNFAMLNNRLADHYGIEGVEGPEIRKVKLPENHVRGGYLSQAAILKVSANGTNTSPVVRGVWVLERILGEHAPPPPPGVPGIEPDTRGATTLRELLAKHRDIDSCRTCHEMIDPPGFALEVFNPIGGERTAFRTLGTGERVNKIVHGRKIQYRIGPHVDATGELQDGRKFSGFEEFREYLVADEERLTHSFVSKLMTFGTGRELGFSDRAEIQHIVETALAEDYGMRDLIHAVVQSEIFQNK